MAGPSTLQVPCLQGTKPGLLDPSQPARLLRFSNSELSFAAFDPRTATATTDARYLSFQEPSYRPKRIVIETTPSGESFWRFVPKARYQDGVHDEGMWPRFVDICGTLYECSQDQWDLYKLDPFYECMVHEPPMACTISRAEPRPPQPPRSGGKRCMLTPSPERDSSQGTKRKAQRMAHVPSETEMEVEPEDTIQQERPRKGERLKMVREQVEMNRKARREKIRAACQRAEAQDEIIYDPQGGLSPTPPNGPATSPMKRKGSLISGSASTYHRHQTEIEQPTYKRPRRLSPNSVRRELEERRTERRQQKIEKWEQKLDERRYMWEKVFMDEILKDVHEQTTGGFDETVDSSQLEGEQQSRGSQTQDAEREARIAESRRKLAELEADRPLWEEAARKRILREKEEEEARRAKAEERKREAAMQAEAEQRAKAQKEAEELRQREEILQQDRQEFLRRERARRQQQRQRGYMLGPWTTQRALEQYKMTCEIFDNTKFSRDDPLTIDDIPWPVLQSPATFTLEDVDWSAVERFFDAVQFHMSRAEFKAIIQASHRRFHPDRWRARGLLKSVIDDTEKECLEVAANLVAQALTPLWANLKS